MQRFEINHIFKFFFCGFLVALAACAKSTSTFDQFSSSSPTTTVPSIPSGSIIISSNNNGTTGPGLISVWTANGDFDRIIYDYTKVTIGYASGLALFPPAKIFAITDTGGGASNDFLDIFDYTAPMTNPTNLFSSLTSGAATTYTRQMAFVTDTTANRYYVFASEAGNNRIARLSSPVSTVVSEMNFTRDFNFSANGTCTLTTPYGVASIPGTSNVAVIHSAATGRVNIFDYSGTCIGSASQTNTPTGVAYHALSGKLLVVNSGNSSITANNATTGALSPATAIYTSAGVLSTPKVIASDASGYFYVSSDGLDQVVKFYWDGSSATATYLGTIIPSSIFTQNITSILVVP